MFLRLAVCLLVLASAGTALAELITILPGQQVTLGGNTIFCRDTGGGGDCQPRVDCDECRSGQGGGRQTCTIIPCEGPIQQYQRSWRVPACPMSCAMQLLFRSDMGNLDADVRHGRKNSARSGMSSNGARTFDDTDVRNAVLYARKNTRPPAVSTIFSYSSLARLSEGSSSAQNSFRAIHPTGFQRVHSS